MDEKGQKKNRITGRMRIIAGIVLLVAGIAIIVSAIIVPLYNKKKNDEAVKDILDGKYAQTGQTDSQPVTGQSVSPEAADASTESVQPQAQDPRMEGILADNSRIGIVQIEKIDVLYAIVEGTQDEQINRAIGHESSSAGIGAQGNCVIAGHRGGYYGTFFERLPELEMGDEVVLTDLNGVRYHYVVYEQLMVDPPDWSVTNELKGMDGETMHILTLITCEDDTRKRIIVHAALYATENP